MYIGSCTCVKYEQKEVLEVQLSNTVVDPEEDDKEIH